MNLTESESSDDNDETERVAIDRSKDELIKQLMKRIVVLEKKRLCKYIRLITYDMIRYLMYGCVVVCIPIYTCYICLHNTSIDIVEI